jgi:hypothetical protein
MTAILVGDCVKNNLFEIWDADAARETEFELIVAKALMCIYPAYHCFPFGARLNNSWVKMTACSPQVRFCGKSGWIFEQRNQLI